jgi:predicted nucleic acid-binding protein
VLLDTDVFSPLFVSDRDSALRQGHPIDDWNREIAGYRVVVSFQTRAEVLTGALQAGWGAVKLGSVRARLDMTPTIDEDREVVDAFAQLTADCRKVGHGLGAKQHTADRWIAACAIAKDIPLLAKDKIYLNAPGLWLFGEPNPRA